MKDFFIPGIGSFTIASTKQVLLKDEAIKPLADVQFTYVTNKHHVFLHSIVLRIFIATYFNLRPVSVINFVRVKNLPWRLTSVS